MTIDAEPLFPDDLSDEAASVLSEFVYALAFACENRYLTQVLRHHERQRQLPYDPDHPWRTRPPD